MSVSLSVERDKIQRQVEQLEQSLSTYTNLELLSSETGDESDDDSEEEEQSAAGLLAQREKIQNEIQNLESVLGPHSPISLSDHDSSSSEESELGLSPSADSCLQMNLVYQHVIQETLDQLETLLTVNHRQQKELVSQMSGPIKEPSRDRPASSSSCQQPINMYLGRFLKPYFKDKLTGLGPPANQETKEKASRSTGSLDDKKLRVKRWENWQKTLLIHAVTRDSLRRLIQPKLSKVDYLSQKLSRSAEADRQQLKEQIDSLEGEIDLIRRKKEMELIGDQYEEHDWQKIANVDFEGTRDAEDIRRFWQNFLHPSVNKTPWSKAEVQQLKEISRRHQERYWQTIAAEMGTGRTAFMCLQTFQRFVSDSLKRGAWTPAEDTLLQELVDKMRIGNFIPYTQMTYFMEGRDPAQLIYRWNQVLDPSLKKGPWTPHEDQLLLQAVSQYGEKEWWKIRLKVPGRTDSSCRDRYFDCLKAETKRGPFDQQERQLLLQLVNKYGVGRWAKIASEIPHRLDAQCMREWRKMIKPPPPVGATRDKRNRRLPTSQGGVKTTKKRGKKAPISPLTKVKVKVKEEEEEESSEDEGLVVVYMDNSDEEEEKKKKKTVVEVEKEEEAYTFPPMQEWIPVEAAQSVTFLSFRPVELVSSGVAHNHVRVRSTILGKFGRSVIIGPCPKDLQWTKRHSSTTMMMVTPYQLQAHLLRRGQNITKQSSGRVRKTQIGRRCPLGRVSDVGLGYELQAAVTPWIGNLLIPPKNRLTTADALRERGEKTQLPTTPVFLLLLQTLYVDAMGCKEMIEQRRKRVVSLAPPPQRQTSIKKNTVAEMLQQRKAMKEKQAIDLQHKMILKHLQVLQQQQMQNQQQQLLLKVQPPPPLPPHNHPGILHHMPPNMHLQMSPMSFPQAVFIPRPVTQPSSIKSPAPHRPSPPVGVNTLPLPAPQRLNAPPVSVVPVSLNATTTFSAVPVTQNLTIALPPSPNRHVSIGSTRPDQHAAPSITSNTKHSGPAPRPSKTSSSKGRRQKVAEDKEAVCSSQNEVGYGVAGACTGVDGAGNVIITQGRRIRKPSQRAKALQEATKAKTGAKRKAAPSQRKRTLIQTAVPVPPQTVVPVPPQTVVPFPPQSAVPVPPQSAVPVPPQTAVPVPPQTAVPVPPQSAVPVPPQTAVPVPPQTAVPVPPQSAVPVPPQSAVPVPPQSAVPVPPQTAVPVPPQTAVPVPPQSAVPVPPQSAVPVPPQTVVPAPPQTAVPISPQNQSLRLNAPPISVNSSPLHLNTTTVCSDRTVSSTQSISLARLPSVPTNQHLTSSTSSLPAPFLNDHDYTSYNVQPSQCGSNSTQPLPDSTPDQPPKAPLNSRKRRRGEKQPSVTSSQDDQCVSGTGRDVIQEGKRVRQPSERLRALQEAIQMKAEAKKKKASSSPLKKRSRMSRSKGEVVAQNQPVTQPSGFSLLPGQSMFVMTPGGLVQLTQAPPQGLQLAFVPCAPLPPPPGNHQLVTPPLQFAASSPRSCVAQPPTAVPVPVNFPVLNQPCSFPVPSSCTSNPLPPAFNLQPVSDLSSCPSQPSPKLFLPYKGTVRVDPAAPPPLRRERLQFDPSLMFLESQEAVHDWLSGQGGVVVPGLGVALPYLPPFISSLNTLSALLRAKKCLTTSSLQLLSQGSESRRPSTTPKPYCSTKWTSSPPPDLPDSTSDLRPAQDMPVSSVNPDLLQDKEEEDEEEKEAELVLVARQLVAERFSSNPAYQLLKARFLSCFTVPALLATMQPSGEKAMARPANEEEEEEKEEVEMKKLKERARRRRAERSLLCDGSGAPASHFSGIITNTSGPDQSRLDQTSETQSVTDK